ncbi:unnamed protein product [Polarella glacialis]|uniref:carnosine N-methyltransferase n=1 Tax=Polarella glacialis TaxID=89957 RepID=A0A813KTM4_POLGL|nr:unnamed protein product [Polarella glacialis]
MSRCLLLVGLAAAAQACDVGYNFGQYKDVHATELRVTLTWWTVEPVSKANVYLSTATGTACNSGYFGAQFHPTSGSVLFSMWDNPKHVGLQNNSEFPFQSLPAGGNCWRNALDASGKSTGVQCGQPWPRNKTASQNVSFHLGAPYEFKLAMTMQNASGALWEVTMLDPVIKSTMSVGRIFFVDAPLGLPMSCRALGQSQDPPKQGLSSYTFLEYFEAPFDYTTVATWKGFTAFAPDGTQYKVPDIMKDCCGKTYGQPPTGGFLDTSRRCLPPECDELELTMMCGPYVKPSKSAVAANPNCLEAHRQLGTTMHDCWQNGPPSSLDECFAHPALKSLPGALRLRAEPFQVCAAALEMECVAAGSVLNGAGLFEMDHQYDVNGLLEIAAMGNVVDVVWQMKKRRASASVDAAYRRVSARIRERYSEDADYDLGRLQETMQALDDQDKILWKVDPAPWFHEIQTRVNVNSSFLKLFPSEEVCGAPLGPRAKELISIVPQDHRVASRNSSKVRSTLRQFVRDWAVEGEAEREASYAPLINAMKKHLPPPAQGSRVRAPSVLCPGSGLGRLPFELVRLGYAAQGNEFSYHMLLGSHLILNRSHRPGCFPIFPYVLSTSNRKGRWDHLHQVKVPDVCPRDVLNQDSELSMCAGEFVAIYENQVGAWDGLATCFFLDTAKNVFLYIRTIAKILRTGGIWANIGPLLFHYADVENEMSVELSWEEIKPVICRYFDIVEEETRIARYTSNAAALGGVRYRCIYFVAVRNSEAPSGASKPVFG